MRSLLRFVIGAPGWGWVAWHLAILATLLPCGYVLWWLRKPSPGRGGTSLVAAAALLLFLAALTVVSLVNAMLFARTLAGTGLGRYLKAVGVWLLCWPLTAALLGVLANRADIAGLSPMARRLALVGFLLLVALFYAVNLLLLARVRAHGAGS